MLSRIPDAKAEGSAAGGPYQSSMRADADTKLMVAVPPADDSTNRKNMALLIQLRWTAVIGQIGTIAFVQLWLGIALPLLPMIGVIGALVLLNLASLVWLQKRREISNRELLIALTLDVLALTVQLYLSGGATNPFTSLYLLQVILGAVLLNTGSSWFLVALACASFAGLTVFYRPLELPHHDLADFFNLYVVGTFIGLALNAILLVIFVTRINRNLRERDAHVAALRQHAVEEDHIVRMGLLASGAAHELGTPLASMSVILSDWRRMQQLTSDPELAEDLAEMEASLHRCKTIVTGILVSAGEARGEGSSATTVNRFFTEVVDEWRTARSATSLSFTNDFGKDLAIASDTALMQVIFNVLDNAVEASHDAIEMRVEREEETLVIRISDRGPGFSDEMLAQLGKPYQSSKGRPGGGLGLFLVFNIIRKLGGTVAAQNRPQGGATVTLTLPLSALAIGDQHVD